MDTSKWSVVQVVPRSHRGARTSLIDSSSFSQQCAGASSEDITRKILTKNTETSGTAHNNKKKKAKS